MKLILIGIQGAGKSTQGNLLATKLNLPYLSTGHIFREMAKEHTPIARYIKETMNAGYLIPDEKTVQIVSEYLHKPEYAKGYIMDGFPRTIDQAKTFENGIAKAIYLEVPDKEALWRLAGRSEEGERGDDTLKAILKRIELYHRFTDPVIDYYRQDHKLITVNGEQSIEKIQQEILEKLHIA